MTIAITLFVIGLLLSAFFSGSETGMYRVSRTKLVLDGLGGSRSARGIIWLLNRPEVFVATALVGNNLANYITSLAIVMGAASLIGGNQYAELIGPILMTPFVFVLGELMPKYLFFHAPYRLVKRTRAFLLAAAILFSPISLLLGLLGRALQGLTGQTPLKLRLTMARGELDQILRDGHEAGILAEGQKSLAQALLEVGNRTALSFGVRVDRLATIDMPVDVNAARHQARRKNHPMVLVRQSRRIVGALFYADLCVREPKLEIKPVIRGKVSDRHIRILLRLYDTGSDVAVLYDERGDVRGVVTRRQLLKPLRK